MKAEGGRMKWGSERRPRPLCHSIVAGHLSFGEAIRLASDPDSVQRNWIVGACSRRASGAATNQYFLFILHLSSFILSPNRASRS